MAVKVGTDVVISDTKELSNIETVDDTSTTAINNAIVGLNNAIIIKDANGDPIKTVYGANSS